ncbi:unnamed protein product [Phytophthora lilii]|uniref:Unnamed protein product n=1 Tax=Phytophthora lilii TaxID=2077276 RepID=A0A9W6TMW0_9STRA|nr:unnamed protein product [Phytophthora lilii]
MAGASPKKNGGSAPHTPKQSPPRASPSPSPSPSRGPDDVDADELTALIKAVKFAHPEFGVKRVHDQVLSHGGKFARVPFKRVKRYMHKLGMNSPSDEDDKTPVKLMTVGGDSKSQRDGPSAEPTDDMVWLPVKLDEPASKLQEFPYQAVIRMTTSEEGQAEGSLGEIYKIQVAMEADGSLSTMHPMLVYNKARSRKTFLHPDSPAYLPVQRLVAAQGQKGAVGGSKAYFWGRYFKIEDMLYINTEKIAPAQQW